MLSGTITCPHCGEHEELEMPMDRCIPFVACSHCGKMIETKKENGHCCVFCQYGDKPCPIEAHRKQ